MFPLSRQTLPHEPYELHNIFNRNNVSYGKPANVIVKLKKHAHSKVNASPKALYTQPKLPPDLQNTLSKIAFTSTETHSATEIKLILRNSQNIFGINGRKNQQYRDKMVILDRVPRFQNGLKRCELCLTEKFHIIFQRENISNPG